MGRKVIKKAAGIVVLAILLILFLSGTWSKNIVTEIVSQRADIMSGYYSGELTYKEACEGLSRIETGELFKEDMASLKKFLGTDIEEIKACRVKKVEVNYEDDDVICAFVSIEWVISNLDGLYRGSDTQNIIGNYSVILENEDNIFKMVQFC